MKENTYEDWDYDNSGLTEEAALAVSIAVSAATGGVGGVILGAGISSLASTGAVNLINAISKRNNLNDALHETTRNTLTEDNLRNAAVAVVAAGVTYGIDAGVEKWGGGSDFAQTYTGSYSQKIINTTANTAVHSLAEGKTLREFGYSLEDAYKTLAIDTAAEKGAKFIGENFAGGSLKGGVGSTAYWQHKGAHALLGCAVGAAKSGECASGAAGAVIGEVIAEAAGKSLIKDGEFSDTDEWLTRTAGTTAAIFGTSAIGGDFNVASDTAENAIDNNLIPQLIAAAKGAIVSAAVQVAEQMILGDKDLLDALQGIDVTEVLTDAALDGVTLGVGTAATKANKIRAILQKYAKGGNKPKKIKEAAKQEFRIQAASDSKIKIIRSRDKKPVTYRPKPDGSYSVGRKSKTTHFRPVPGGRFTRDRW